MINSKKRGFIAITTTMILSVILLVVATSLSFSGFFTRYNILDSELKKVSVALAEGCVDQALLKLATDPGYSPTNEVVNIDSKLCTINSVNLSGGFKVVSTQSKHMDYYTNLVVKVNPTTLLVNSWEEVASP